MEKRDRETFETIDLEKMDRVSGGCARCTGAPGQGGAANPAGAVLQQLLAGSGGARR